MSADSRVSFPNSQEGGGTWQDWNRRTMEKFEDHSLQYCQDLQTSIISSRIYICNNIYRIMYKYRYYICVQAFRVFQQSHLLPPCLRTQEQTKISVESQHSVDKVGF